eukprot:TRINITY_DN26174_c0_g1_i3.p1 TRINITY_DN26174_c0_g1~~TRINITY_DN26174_c0_g1_i3.p1  ORF type:complete len:926 (+),score=196.77 TRINITY_DN26174_c0_g1_i3:90-2867(+)
MMMQGAPPPPSDLPEFSHLGGDPGVWQMVMPPLSHATRINGDWQAYPHLSDKKVWKEKMGERSGIFARRLEEKHGAWVQDCEICKAFGGGFQEHVTGTPHFKKMGQQMPDGVPLEHYKHNWWVSVCVLGGEIRFNHMDGTIEMKKDGSHGPGPGMFGAAPSMQQQPMQQPMQMPPHMPPVHPSSSSTAVVPVPLPPGVPGGGGLDEDMPVLPHINELPLADPSHPNYPWQRVSKFICMPTVKGGDYNSVPIFSSRAAWKEATTAPAAKLFDVLTKHDIWDACALCKPNCQCSPTHLPGEIHFKRVLERLVRPGVSISAVSSLAWEQWNVADGAIRFNHIHFAIDMCRGVIPQAKETLWDNPDLMQRLVEGSKAGAPQPALPAPVMHQALPASSPGPYPNGMLGVAAPMQPAAGVMRPAGGGGTVIKAPFNLPNIESIPGDQLPNPRLLAQEGVWHQLWPPASTGMKKNGDWQCYSHLQSKAQYKQGMTEPAKLICQILERGQRMPINAQCDLCGPNARYFMTHLPADMHYKTLLEHHLRDGVAVDVARTHLWHEWRLENGIVRLNYADGEIQMVKGEPVENGMAAPAAEPAAASPCMQQPAAPGMAAASASIPPALPPEVAAAISAAGGMPNGIPPGQAPMANGQQPSHAPPVSHGAAAGFGAPAPQPDWAMKAYMSLWQHNHSKRAVEFAKNLSEATDPPVCSICDGESMVRGVAGHLTSESHLRKLLAAAAAKDCLEDLGQSPQERQRQNKPIHLLQRFEMPGGKLCLDHLSLECVFMSTQGANGSTVSASVVGPPAQAAPAPAPAPHSAPPPPNVTPQEATAAVGGSGMLRPSATEFYPSSPPAPVVPVGLMWHRVNGPTGSVTMWQRSDGAFSFRDDDQASGWALYTIPPHGVCWYHHATDSIFQAETGRDLGKYAALLRG